MVKIRILKHSRKISFYLLPTIYINMFGVNFCWLNYTIQFARRNG